MAHSEPGRARRGTKVQALDVIAGWMVLSAGAWLALALRWDLRSIAAPGKEQVVSTGFTVFAVFGFAGCAFVFVEAERNGRPELQVMAAVAGLAYVVALIRQQRRRR